VFALLTTECIPIISVHARLVIRVLIARFTRQQRPRLLWRLSQAA